MHFQSYEPAFERACLALFDENCPIFFAPNEREEYREFLALAARGSRGNYRVCISGDEIVGAFGLMSGEREDRRRLNWILLSPRVQGRGHGREIMNAIKVEASSIPKVTVIDIAASHLSAPFFERHGARVSHRLEDGWGPGMHRVDMTLAVQRE